MEKPKRTKKLKAEEIPAAEVMEQPAAPAILAYSISRLSEKISGALASGLEKNIWVYGEIYRFVVKPTAYSRAAYLQLIENDPLTKKPKASISAAIWGNQLESIQNKLRQAGVSFEFKDGLEIKVRGSVDYYAPQGRVSFIINDIDVEYTAGKLALQKKQLLEKLQKLGLLDRNKQFAVPEVPLKVGLITSETSAGYNDFINELQTSGYSFKVYLCDARMQGDQLQEDVVTAISTLNRTDADVIVIVRGGGSVSDLMGFDNEEVALAIAKSNKPVFTGIGHQIDSTVADEVANRHFKTPTAAAQYLVEEVRKYEETVENSFEQILERQGALIESRKEELGELVKLLGTNTLRFLNSHQEKLNSLNNFFKLNLKHFVAAFVNNLKVTTDMLVQRVSYITSGSRQKIAGSARQLAYLSNKMILTREQLSAQLVSRIGKCPANIISRQARQIDNWEIQTKLKDPLNILKKGYSLIYAADNKVVKSAGQVEAGDNIRALLKDGQITAVVKEKN